MARFTGRNVIVTGSGRGIGRAIAEAFVAEGAYVIAVDVDPVGLAALAERHGDMISPLQADLGDTSEAKDMIDTAVGRAEHIDVLVNNAGIMPSTPILEIDEAVWDRVWAINMSGPFWATQTVSRHMIAEGRGGAVINIASANAFQVESPQAHYNASKAALVMLTRSFAHELSHHGIRFNCVAPGETVTPDEAASMSPEDVALERIYVERIPLRRVAHATEQAAAVLFLASDDASFITGQTLVVDGGELTGSWFDPSDQPPVPQQWFE
jgi:NAD(P)-dependent dehydrogenase (short-subunit alcohol dehydrogenase family)